MTTAAFGGVHDDAALIELDGSVAASRADGECGALIHFHIRTIQELHGRVRSGRGTNELFAVDFVPGFQHASVLRAHREDLAVSGSDSRANTRRPGEIPASPRPHQTNQRGRCGCNKERPGGAPTGHVRCRFQLPIRSGIGFKPSSMNNGAARNAFTQMVFHNGRASRPQFVFVKRRKQGTNIATTLDHMPGLGGRQVSFARLDLLPHPPGGCSK